MKHPLETLEAEAVAVFQRKGLHVGRREARFGTVFDVVGVGLDPIGQRRELALSVRWWLPDTAQQQRQYAAREAQFASPPDSTTTSAFSCRAAAPRRTR